MGGLELKVPPPFVFLILVLLMWLANHLMRVGPAFAMAFGWAFGLCALYKSLSNQA